MESYVNSAAAQTAAQNQSVALNSITRILQYVTGQYTTKTFAGDQTVQINTSSCRLVNVSVVVSGGESVKFYNTASTNALLDDNLLYVLDAGAPIGVTQVGVQFSDGLAMVVGEGVSVNATYSVGT